MPLAHHPFRLPARRRRRRRRHERRRLPLARLAVLAAVATAAAAPQPAHAGPTAGRNARPARSRHSRRPAAGTRRRAARRPAGGRALRASGRRPGRRRLPAADPALAAGEPRPRVRHLGGRPGARQRGRHRHLRRPGRRQPPRHGPPPRRAAHRLLVPVARCSSARARPCARATWWAGRATRSTSAPGSATPTSTRPRCSTPGRRSWSCCPSRCRPAPSRAASTWSTRRSGGEHPASPARFGASARPTTGSATAWGRWEVPCATPTSPTRR